MDLNRFLIAAGLLLGMAVNTDAQAARCHVDRQAAGANDGSSWANAYTGLQSALADTSCSEIWVAKGVYKPDPGTDDHAHFSIRPGVKVHGGFVGTETSASQANPGANRTVLSGDIDGNDTVDADGVTRSHADIVGNNSGNVVMFDATTALGSIQQDTVLDGFAITGGKGRTFLTQLVGGALYCNGDANGRACNPLLSRLWVAGNTGAGGSFFLRGENGGRSNPVIRASTFSGNFASLGGSAILVYGFAGEASPVIENVSFIDNTAGSGAVWIQGSESAGVAMPVFRNVTFTGNHSPGGRARSVNIVAERGAVSSADIAGAILWSEGSGSEVIVANAAGSELVIKNSVLKDGCPGAQANCQDLVSGDPLLGAPQDHGDGLPTAMPGEGSIAIDAANPTTCGIAPADVDQRGVSRPQGGGCDLGAIEVRQSTVSLVATVGSGGSVSAAATPAPSSGAIANCSSAGGSSCEAHYGFSEITGAADPVTLTAASGWFITAVTPIPAACGGTLSSDARSYVTASLTQDCRLDFELSAANQTGSTLVGSMASSIYGESLTFTATVTVLDPAGLAPTGSVRFEADGQSIGCDAQGLSATAPFAATCSTSVLAAGDHTITVQYGGDANYPAPQPAAAPVPLHVSAAGAGLSLSSSPNPSTVGQTVTLIAALTPPSGNPMPTGSIGFFDGASPIAGCSSVALSDGTASCTTTALTVGSHALQVEYAGDGNYLPSSDTLQQQVQSIVVNDPKPVPTASGWMLAILAAALALGGVMRAARSGPDRR